MMSKNQTTPKWQEMLEMMKTEAFSSPWQGEVNQQKFIQHMTDMIKAEDKMHFKRPDMLSYISYGDHNEVKGQGIPDYSTTNQVRIPESMSDNQSVIQHFLKHLFDKHNNPSHPFFVQNVLPPVNIASILAGIMTFKLNPNISSVHYSGNVAKAELELASMIISQLSLGSGDHQWPIPFAPPPPKPDSFFTFNSWRDYKDKPMSGGISTFGGTGCYMYTIKYFLTEIVNSGELDGYDSRARGFEKGKFVILVSDQGHYCSSNVTDWCGIGHDNVIRVETDPDHCMILKPNLEVEGNLLMKKKRTDLESKLQEAKNGGKIVVAVVGTFGTTESNSLDDIKGIREIIDHFENLKNPKTQKQYRKPFLYADSVIGWVWLLFSDYDFAKNPLGFEDQGVLMKIKENSEKSKFLVEADAFAADFHKVGYSYYPASMIFFKNYVDFIKTMKRPPSAYLLPEQYNPSLYTLETSRCGIGSIGPWTAFHYFGKDGMRSLIYNLMDLRKYFQQKLLKTKCAVICNPNNQFYSILFRLYPIEYSQEKYQNELKYYELYEYFKCNNEFQKLIYCRLQKYIKCDSTPEDPNTPPRINFSPGFRNTYYHYERNGLEKEHEHNGLEKGHEHNGLEKRKKHNGLKERHEYNGLEGHEHNGLKESHEYNGLEGHEHNRLKERHEHNGLKERHELNGLEEGHKRSGLKDRHEFNGSEEEHKPNGLEEENHEHNGLKQGHERNELEEGRRSGETPSTPLQGVFALKCYISSPFLDREFVDKMIENIIKIKNEVVFDCQSAKFEYNDPTTLIPGDVPQGAHIYHNLVQAKFIPLDYFLKK